MQLSIIKGRTVARSAVLVWSLMVAACGSDAALGPAEELTEGETPAAETPTDDDAAALATLGEIELQGVRPSAYLLASQQDEALSASGFSLNGRLWLGPSLATSTYVDGNGLRFGVLLARTTDPLPKDMALALEFQNRPSDETVGQFVNRMQSDATFDFTAREIAGEPTLAIFDAKVDALSAAKTLQTVGKIENCSGFMSISYEPWVKGCYGYTSAKQNSVLIQSWDEREYGNARPAHSANGVNGAWALTCVDKGTATYTATFSNARFGAAPASTTLTLPVNGNFFSGTTLFGENKHERYCATSVFGACVDYRYRNRFNSFNVSLRSLPGPNSEVLFGGTFTTKADEYWGDYSCADTAQCPSPHYPTEGNCLF